MTGTRRQVCGTPWRGPSALLARRSARLPKLDIPTIGIGSGTDCDGQVQVVTDILGIGDFTPKHAKRFANVGEIMQQAMKQYADEVKAGTFPGKENRFDA